MEGKAASDSPAKATPSLGTYQLVVVDHDQLHILGLTVHCRVPPTDLGVGGHLESVPTKPGIMTKPWTDSGGGGLYSSQGQCQLPWDGVGVPCSLCMRAGSLSLPTKGMCIDNSVRERGGGASSVWALLCPPPQMGMSSCSGPQPEVFAAGGLCGPPYLPFPSQPRPVGRSRVGRGSKQAAWGKGAGEGGTAGSLPHPTFPPLPGSLHPRGAGRRGVR